MKTRARIETLRARPQKDLDDLGLWGKSQHPEAVSQLAYRKQVRKSECEQILGDDPSLAIFVPQVAETVAAAA